MLLTIIPDSDTHRKPKIARYEIMWERDDSMGDVILDAWENAPPRSDLGSVAFALRNVMCSLQDWSRENFGSVRKKLEELRAQLADLNGRPYNQSRQLAKESESYE